MAEPFVGLSTLTIFVQIMFGYKKNLICLISKFLISNKVNTFVSLLLHIYSSVLGKLEIVAVSVLAQTYFCGFKCLCAQYLLLKS